MRDLLRNFAIGTVVILVVGASRGRDAPTCLVLDAGKWWPYAPGEIWNGPSKVELTLIADPLMNSSARTKDWRAATRGDPTASEYNRAWAWRSPTVDSVEILRPAILSEGIEFMGVWRGDTLLGRAHAFSDMIGFQTPRAFSYGFRFRCGDSRQQAAALTAVALLRVEDSPDTALSFREDSVWLSGIRRATDSLIHQTDSVSHH